MSHNNVAFSSVVWTANSKVPFPRMSESCFWKKHYFCRNCVSSLLLSWKSWQTAQPEILKTEKCNFCYFYYNLQPVGTWSFQWLTDNTTNHKEAGFDQIRYDQMWNHILAKWCWAPPNTRSLPPLPFPFSYRPHSPFPFSYTPPPPFLSRFTLVSYFSQTLRAKCCIPWEQLLPYFQLFQGNFR